MVKITIVGAGHIGRTIADLLALSDRRRTPALLDSVITVVDSNLELLSYFKAARFIREKVETIHHSFDPYNIMHDDVYALNKADIIINAGPHFITKKIIDLAVKTNAHYFDMTEDVIDAEYAQQASHHTNALIAPQCGLAPGFVTIVASHFMQELATIDSVKLRVGALPANPTNALKYNITWSVDGLVNEYLANGREVIDGKNCKTKPLTDVERLTILGTEYEAFNTSGGIGTLFHSQAGRINYKTLRYVGHLDLVKFLIDDLKMGKERNQLAHAFKVAAPMTTDDVVVISVSATGTDKNGKIVEKNYTNKIGNKDGYTAIQRTTAGALCAVVNMFLDKKIKQSGFLLQEEINVSDFLSDYYGKIYRLG